MTAAPGRQCFPAGTASAPSAVVMCWLQQQRALQPCQAVGTHPASPGTADTGLLSRTTACLVYSLELALLLCSITLQRHASREECLLAISVSQLFSLLPCVLRILRSAWLFYYCGEQEQLSSGTPSILQL